MDDEDIAVFIPTGDDSHMGVIRIEYQIAGKRVCPGDCRTVGMLAGRAAAMTNDVGSFRGVVEHTIVEFVPHAYLAVPEARSRSSSAVP